jgi:hypothetical protein
MSKYIFLDIDGVLNCNNTTDDCFGMTGIEDRLVKKLSTIVNATGAEIVLTSTWRDYWEPDKKEIQDAEGTYLDEKLLKQGLHISAKTDPDWLYKRGDGIIEWLKDKNVESFVILDDEPHDYKEVNLEQHWIQTYDVNDGGITDEDVVKAIKILS